MQILLVTPGYPPSPGGIETHVAALARGLVRRGVDVEVWTHGPSGRDIDEDGVPVRRFRATRSHRFPIAPGLLRSGPELRSRGGLLHVHAYHATPALIALRAEPSRPVVLTPHFHGVGHTRLAQLVHVPYRPIGARLFRRADAVVAVSSAEAGLIEERNPECSDRIRVIRNGADVAAIQQAVPFDGQPPTVLVAGRQEAYKRIDAVIDAFGMTTGDGQLVLTGDGPDGVRLRELAARSPRAGQIRFTGHVGLAELRRWQRTAVALVSLSGHEAFGLVAIEGVAGGAHAILSDIPAHRETQDFVPTGSVTLISRPEDRAEVTTAIQTALDSAKPAPADVRSWDDVVDDHIALYGNLLRG